MIDTTRSVSGWARLALAALVAGLLSGCGAERVWAPDDAVQQALWRADGPSTITLVTVINVRSKSGAHSALLVNGSHRALFDPAGTFKVPFVPERNDVLFGMDDRAWKVFIDYHARETFDVQLQEVTVTPAQAEAALTAMQAHGAAPKASCNLAVTRVLSQVPGFEGAPGGYFPKKTAAWFRQQPDVRETVISDDDADDNHGVLFRASQPQIIESDT